MSNYGYETDEVRQSSNVFGLNPGSARMIKFEWINNAGKDGAEMEALDIQFEIVGSDRPTSYRLFPITKAFAKDGTEITDPKAPEFQKALKDLNSCVTHILHNFVEIDQIKTALSVPIASFKDFCKVCMSILPKDYEKKKLDIFFQWQWQIKGEAKVTYLELPKKMAYGKWLCPAIEPVGGVWTEWKHKSPENSTPIALKYTDAEGNTHPFVRNGWFMLSNFAAQQKAEEDSTSIGTSSDTTPEGTAPEGEAARTGEGW